MVESKLEAVVIKDAVALVLEDVRVVVKLDEVSGNSSGPRSELWGNVCVVELLTPRFSVSDIVKIEETELAWSQRPWPNIQPIPQAIESLPLKTQCEFPVWKKDG